jgi:predicted Rossmann fold nucleotide-binding protein DprA/Smf involved in DNA uptake
MKAATITGHRTIGPKSIKRVWTAARTLLDNLSVDEIYLGGASGVDTEFLKAALQYRVGARPRIIVVVPDTVDRQPVSTRVWTKRADEVIELREPITEDNRYLSYKKRNEYIVDRGTFVVAFFNGDFRSGTGSAINYAKKCEKKVYTIPVSLA